MDNEYWRKRLKAWRDERGLTEDEAGKAAGLSQSQINHIERGKRGFTQKTLDKLLKLYKKDYNDLFSYITTEDLRLIVRESKRKNDRKDFDPIPHRKLPSNVVDLLKKLPD